MTSVASNLENKLSNALSPVHLEVLNESQHHARPGNDTHFRVVVVSPEFVGKRLVARHQMIYRILDAEMKNGIHALTMHTFTADEWQKRGQNVTPSPACQGGSKADRA